ncbi:MAG: amidohydrolase family protein, partial [Chloroflexota bacterium]
THAIGDRALEQVIRCYETLYRRKPSQIRHRIEHLGLPTPDHIARTARMNAIAVPQTVFLPALGRNFRRYLPDDYLARCYPVRSIWQAGITVALSSDAPVVPDDSPLLGMKAAIDRHDHAGNPIAPDEAITVQQALWSYTVGGAIASGDHHNRGSIAAGKLADFVVLERDPLQTPTAALADIRVVRTISGGNTVYES